MPSKRFNDPELTIVFQFGLMAHARKMPELHIYTCRADIPTCLESQILCALRNQWPGDENQVDSGLALEPELHPTFFVLADENQLYRYARTIWVSLPQQGQFLKLYGLGDLFTLPQYRRRGYADRVVQAATSRIVSDPEADAAVLLTEPRLEALHRRSGWEYLLELRITRSECVSQRESSEFAMVLFISLPGRRPRQSLMTHGLELPGDEW